MISVSNFSRVVKVVKEAKAANGAIRNGFRFLDSCIFLVNHTRHVLTIEITKNSHLNLVSTVSNLAKEDSKRHGAADAHSAIKGGILGPPGSELLVPS